MPKTRRLTDLYVVGEEFDIDGIKVWLQKLSPVDHETAVRRANGKRARVLALARAAQENPEGRDPFLNEFYDICEDRESMIIFIAASEISKDIAAFEAEVADEDEWSKDDYIQGLKDLWNNEMAERFVMDAEDEEAKRVMAELERFQAAVDKRISGENDALKRDLDTFSDSVLVKRGVDVLIEAHADSEWLTEYRKCELWLGVREIKNHGERYFESREEVDRLSIEVLSALVLAYQGLNVDVVEGKDSEEPPAS